MKLLPLLLIAIFAQGEANKWVDPPGDETAEVKTQIDAAAIRVRSGQLQQVLIEPGLMPLHPYPRFRKLIEDNAPSGKIQLVGKEEPGEPLLLKLRFGKPNVAMYLYHTSAKGYYAQNATHVRANSGDMKYARIFGYVKSDSEGRVEIKTIRPMGYPGSELPQHIHYHLNINGRSAGGGELQFNDDPRLNAAMRERSNREGAVFTDPVRSANGWVVEAKIPLASD